VWTPNEAYRLLKNVPLLEESGLLVRLPDWWQKRPRVRVAVTIGDKKQGHFNADAMLDFKVNVALGDQHMTQKEIAQIMDAGEGLAYVKGQWVEVNREKLTLALAHWKQVEKDVAQGGVSFIKGMRLLAGAPADLTSDHAAGSEDREWAFVDAGQWLSDILSGLRDPHQLASGSRSLNFNGTLRPYQEVGHNWLWFLASLGLGACLADDIWDWARPFKCCRCLWR
jgi:non-specific serine/threonine protein kinase